MCGVLCLQKSYCKSFNFHRKLGECRFLVTDSRLLQRPNDLGTSTRSPGQDWVHGEVSPSTRGCGLDELTVTDCVWVIQHTTQGVNNVTSLWQLPNKGNLEYPVAIMWQVSSPVTTCGQYSIAAQLTEEQLDNDVRVLNNGNLTPGIHYKFTLSAWYNAFRTQPDLEHYVTTYPAKLVEVEASRVVQTDSVEFHWTIEGCSQTVFFWFSPPGSECTESTPCQISPLQTDSRIQSGLTPGEDYTFYFKSTSNGLYSEELVINQPTYTADAVTGHPLPSVSLGEREVQFQMDFLSGTGDRIVLSYIGLQSGGTYSEERSFSLTNAVTFSELVPGEGHDVTIEAFSKGERGVTQMRREFTMQTYTRPVMPPVLENSTQVKWADFSVEFMCSFYEGYTKILQDSVDDTTSVGYLLYQPVVLPMGGFCDPGEIEGTVIKGAPSEITWTLEFGPVGVLNYDSHVLKWVLPPEVDECSVEIYNTRILNGIGPFTMTADDPLIQATHLTAKAGNGQELRLQCSDTTLGQQMPMLTHSFTIFPFTPDATGYGSVINGMYAISTTWSYTLPGAWFDSLRFVRFCPDGSDSTIRSMFSIPHGQTSYQLNGPIGCMFVALIFAESGGVLGGPLRVVI
ncbi:uncharacterized protein LOC142345007 [Convolutriloba macropyga]|uniref:uncharacterized protein LOC142345007 n=1 Tax=Convolutriloba macropyga TaxID=536237 RepID=UPI003F527272